MALICTKGKGNLVHTMFHQCGPCQLNDLLMTCALFGYRSVVTLGYGSNTPSSSANLFNKIYYDGKGKIAEYYNTLPTLQYQSGGFRVEGSMGSSHKPQINIKFSGINESPTSRG